MENLFEYSDMLRSPIEAFFCGTDYYSQPIEAHWHYFVELIYMQEGTTQISCNDGSYRLEQGSFAIFPPQAIHSIYAADQKPFRYICCKFNLNRIQMSESYLPDLNAAFRKISNMEKPPVVFPKDALCGIDYDSFFMEILHEVQEKQYGYNSYVYSMFSMLILKILRSWRCEGIEFDPEKLSEIEEQTIQNVLVYIDAHSQENINIEALAHSCHMSYSCFAKLFHKYYGQSCKQYIEFVRLSKVENLLLFTGYDLSFIATETGFADCSHLIRAFKKRYEITPKQFRLKHQASAPQALQT